jgi:hypothetical protein
MTEALAAATRRREQKMRGARELTLHFPYLDP